MFTKFNEAWSKDQNAVKIQLFNEAYAEALRDCENGNANVCNDECEFDTETINYSHFCYNLGWPDLQDGGIFEQTIENACRAVLAQLYCLKANY